MNELVGALKGFSFDAFSDYRVGDLYQAFLRQCQQQKRLGAFYTPRETVDYMVSKIDLSENETVIDPACGSGHFLEACVEHLRSKLGRSGHTPQESLVKALSQVWGNDIDPFAVQLSAIRLFFAVGRMMSEFVPNVFVFDSLAMQPTSYTDPSDKATRSESKRVLEPDIPLTQFFESLESALHPKSLQDTLAGFKQLQFDCFIGNPPYGGEPTSRLRSLYSDIYRENSEAYGYELGSNDAFGFFLANAIKRVKNGGRICFIVSDTFLSIVSHQTLRRLILDTCMIDEILLAPIDLFRPLAISRTCILTLRKHLCDYEYAGKSGSAAWTSKARCDCKSCQERHQNRTRLVDRLRSQGEYDNPPKNQVQLISQEAFERIPTTPFWVNVPTAFIDTMALASPDRTENSRNGWGYSEVRLHVKGGAGLQTGDNPAHLVIIEGSTLWKELKESDSGQLAKFRVLSKDQVCDFSKLDESTLDAFRMGGIPGSCFAVPFVKGCKLRYSAPEEWYIDWSPESVQAIKKRARLSKGRTAVFRNPWLYFRQGFITDAHHGMLKAVFVQNAIPAVNTNLFYGLDMDTALLIGYLNSNLASYFLGKIINTSLGGMSGHATPEDIKRIPVKLPVGTEQRKTFERIKARIVKLVNDILSFSRRQPRRRCFSSASANQ